MNPNMTEEVSITFGTALIVNWGREEGEGEEGKYIEI